MKNLLGWLLLGLLCSSVTADDDSNEFESSEIIIDVGPAEPIVTQYSSVVQQNQRKVQPIEIMTPFGYQGIFDEPQQYFSASSFQGLRQFFPALFATLGQTNVPFQSIQQSQFSHPSVESQVRSNFNPDGAFLLNRNIVPVRGVSNVLGVQPSSQTGVFGVNQPIPASIPYNFRASQNRPGIQTVSGFLPQQLTFGSVSSFVPEQYIPIKTTFSQFGVNSNKPQSNQFSVSQPFSTFRQNSVVPTFESNSLVSSAVQQPSFSVGGQSSQAPQQYQAEQNQQSSIAQQIPNEAQNFVFGQGFDSRPQLSSQQSSPTTQQAFGQTVATAQQVAFGKPSVVGQPTFGQSPVIGQPTFGQVSAGGQPSVIGQPTFGQVSTGGQPSVIGQPTFGQVSVGGQPSVIGQPTFGQISAVGQPPVIRQPTFGQVSGVGQPPVNGQPTFGQVLVGGQPSVIGESTFGQVSAGGQPSVIGQSTFGQVSAAGQQASFGQPAGQQVFGQSSTIGQETFGQTFADGQQASFGPSSAQFGQSSVAGQQISGFQQSSVPQAANDNSFPLQQSQNVGQDGSFGQSSFGTQTTAFSSPTSLSQPSGIQTTGQNLFSSQIDSAANQPESINQPAFGALRSDSASQSEQSPFDINEFPTFEFPSAAFKTDVTKVGQDLDYDGSIGNAQFNSGFDFDETESFDTKVYDHA